MYWSITLHIEVFFVSESIDSQALKNLSIILVRFNNILYMMLTELLIIEKTNSKFFQQVFYSKLIIKLICIFTYLFYFLLGLPTSVLQCNLNFFSSSHFLPVCNYRKYLSYSYLTWCAHNRHPNSPSPFWSLSKFCFYEGDMSSACDIKETPKMDLGISGVWYIHTMLI